MREASSNKEAEEDCRGALGEKRHRGEKEITSEGRISKVLIMNNEKVQKRN